MMKQTQSLVKKLLIQRRGLTLLALVMVCLTMIPIISALDFDNRMEYRNNDMTIVLKNWFGLTTIGEATLTSHKTIDEIKKVGMGNDVPVMSYNFRGFKSIYKKGLGEVKFIDMETGQDVQKDYYFAKAIYNREGEIIRYEKLRNKDIPKEETEIWLMTNVKLFETTDGVWEIAGMKVNKHASWTSALTEATQYYYSFDENIGTNAKELVKGINNLTVTGSHWNSTGLIDSAYGFPNADESANMTFELSDFTDDKISISFWVRRNGTMAASSAILDNREDGANGNVVINRRNNTALQFHIVHGGGTEDIDVPISSTSYDHFILSLTNG